MILLNRFIFLLFSLLFSIATIGQITFLEENFYNQSVIDKGLIHPVGIAFDDNGTGYIWQKRGVVTIMDTTETLASQPLIDISEEVMSSGDHGLVGFALDPNFLNNGYFYLFYVVDRHHLLYYGTSDYDPKKTIEKEATIGRITRYQADKTKGFREIIENSRKVLVGQDISDKSFPVLMLSHGMGTLAFGEDGTLLASCGDAAAFERSDIGNAPETYFEQALADGIIEAKENIGAFKSQQVGSLAGKIIRIDPNTGEGVPSNPFYDATTPRVAKSRVWALGFRNPYRFVFKPESGVHDPAIGQPGTFIIGDVGAGSWEELSVLKKGGTNFGWPFYEGHLSKWQFWSNRTLNLDTQNDLSITNQCEDHFYFHELLKEENEQQVYDFINPCDSLLLIPTNIPKFIHARPLLSYNNQSWNPPTRTQVSSFDEMGKAIALAVEEQPFLDIDKFAGYSVIPGFFYQDGNFPEKYQGKLFVADFSGWIKALTLDENDQIIAVEDFLSRDKSIVGLTQHNKNGCLYYLHYDTHAVNKICFGGNPPPVAKIAVDKNYGASPLAVEFDATASLDPFGETLIYFWDFGNGDTSNLANPTFTFTTPNSEPTAKKVRLIVTDEVGNTDESEQIISINNTPPKVTISSFSDGAKYPTTASTFLSLSAEIKDKEHESEALTYTWQVFLHHNTHFHPEPEQYTREGQAIISPLGCNTEPYWYRVRLNVVDAAGLAGFDEKEIFPHCDAPIISNFTLKGKAREDGNFLTWDFTANTKDLNQVELYRGDSPTSMQKISTMTLLESKELLDAQPINGFNYYQLKIQDDKGSYDFSNLITLEFPAPPALNIYPNPINNGFFELELFEAFGEEITVRIYTTTGQQVAMFDYATIENKPFAQRITIPNLLSGLYWCEVENETVFHRSNFVIR